jgi:hypothetical protein
MTKKKRMIKVVEWENLEYFWLMLFFTLLSVLAFFFVTSNNLLMVIVGLVTATINGTQLATFKMIRRKVYYTEE